MKISNPRPASPPLVTWTQMQDQINALSTDQRTLVMDLVDAATDHAEKVLATSLLRRTITATSYSQESRIALPRGPAQVITSIVDANGANITNYAVEAYGHTDYVVMKSNFAAPLTITYVAGYGDTAADVPASIRMAIRTHVTTLWEHRASVSDVELIPVPHSLEDFYRYNRRSSPVA